MPSGHCVPLQSGEMQNDAFSACEQKDGLKPAPGKLVHTRHCKRCWHSQLFQVLQDASTYSSHVVNLTQT